MNRFTGTGVAMITPFNRDYSVDYTSMEKIINHLIDGKVDYIVLLGTTAESVTLKEAEKKSIVRFAIEKIGGRVPVVIGIGGNDTDNIVNQLQTTDLEGISAILSVSPYYNKPTQKGIYLHYKAIAENSPLPIILYNVPGRTGSNMGAETTLQLAHDFSNLIAIKEASGNFEQAMTIVKNKPSNFTVISGDDNLTLPFISIGMEGVISVAAHVKPSLFTTMVNEALKNNYNEARVAHYQLLEMMTSIFAEGNPGGVKSILSSMGLCENVVRLPLHPITDELTEKLKRLI